MASKKPAEWHNKRAPNACRGMCQEGGLLTSNGPLGRIMRIGRQ